jgi:phosphoribosyl-AMP cyclohydrolase
MGTELYRSLEAAAIGEVLELNQALDGLKFDAHGLLPAIAQDADSGEVLMLAWMNRGAIERTLAEGFACYWSRSRACYWRKGESSGHLQALKEMRIDCDGDAILLKVEQSGPACHTNRPNCFYLSVEADQVRVISEPR